MDMHLRAGRCSITMETVLWITTILGLVQTSAGLNLAQCRDSLGMQSGAIPDNAITASSSDDDAVGPQNARIRTEQEGGAWCPRSMISRGSYEYLQIDLGNLAVVTMVEIQGRFGNGMGREWTEQFRLEYQREDGGEWMRFRNRNGQELFQGNVNTYLTALREVSPSIIGRRIRFIPYSTTRRRVCMRVEIYGCLLQVPVQCRDSLGMESREIPDNAITVSSSYDAYSVGAQHARIRTEHGGGAWCPGPMISQGSYEYLQIDLGNQAVVTKVEIQGRFGNGQGQEWAKQFRLEYQPQDGGEWVRFRNRNGQELFQGNVNTYLTALREVSPSIIGRRIRFIPYSTTRRRVCMRVEIYGCLL